MTHELLDDYMAEMLGPPTPPAPARQATPLASVPTTAEPTAPAMAASAPAPDPVAAPVPAAKPIDMVAELMAEFDAEVGGGAPPAAKAAPASPTLSLMDDLLAEFDAEVAKGAAPPAPAATAKVSLVDDLLAEFDAEVAKSGDPIPPGAAPPAPHAPAPPPAPMHSAAATAAAAAADTPRERRRREDVVKRWLRFTVGEQSYAVEVLKVQEVMRLPDVLPLRGAEPALQGVMNLRGLIVPVIDLGVRLGVGEVVPDHLSRVVVLESDGEAMGILVSTVAEVTSISEANIEHPRNLQCGLNCESLTGVCRQNGSLTVLLDATLLLQ